MNLGKRVYRTDGTASQLAGAGGGLYYYSNYPHLYIKNEGVKIEQLVDQMAPVFDWLERYAVQNNIKGFIITSGNDSKHSKNSYHYKNRAIDLSYRQAVVNTILPNWGQSPFGIVSQMKRELNAGGKKYDVIYNSKGHYDHVHIEYDPSSKVADVYTEEPQIYKAAEDYEVKTEPTPPIVYIHKNPLITTVNDLIKTHFSMFKNYDYEGGAGDLMFYDGGTGQKNIDRVESMYTRESEKFPLLKLNTVMLLDPTKVNRNFLATQSEGQVIDYTTFPAFLSEQRQRLESNPGYRPTFAMQEYNGQKFDTQVQYINSDWKVWVYLKSLNKILDLSDFLTDVQVTASYGEDSFSFTSAFFNELSETDYSAQERVLLSEVGDKLAYVAKLLSVNDIVWIRFEELEMERTKQIVTEEDLTIDKSNLAGNVYDIIGLISNISSVQQVGDGVGSVTVSGQSLSKVFAEDEAIFLPYSVVSDSMTGNLLMGNPQNRNLLQRAFADGSYNTLFSKNFRTIEDTLKFYLNQLSNVAILPSQGSDAQGDSFFSSYADEEGDRRTRVYSLTNQKVQGVGDNAEVVSQELQKGIYQIIKLSVDPAIKFRKIVDSSCFNPQGTIQSLLYKVAQEPLVELLMDTYGDTFNLVARKPPYDFKSIEEYTHAVDINEEDLSVEITRFRQPLWLTIEASDVQTEQLDWNQVFYTWFKMEAKGAFLGMQDATSLARIPLVYFSQYVDLWGSKPLSFVSNYTNSDTLGTPSEKMQLISDLLYVIESNMYLPFTRRGTITLNKGDRRYKKGTWVRYAKTGEIFYIDSVQNTASVSAEGPNRSTVLGVSRGMVQDYIYDKYVEIDGREVPVSYFRLINLQNLRESLERFLIENKQGVARNVLVEKDVFDFFLKKRQFDQ